MLNEDIAKKELTNLGLTNQNYIYTLDTGKRLFVRVPYDHNLELFNYEIESKVIQLIEPLNINLPTYAIDPETGVKISPYIPHLKHLDEIDLDWAAEQVALKLRKLHQCQPIGYEFDVIQKYTIFKNKTDEFLFDLSSFEFLLNQYKNYPQRVLCHNDLVNGNIVCHQDNLYIIDYEYAADNHPYFDLLSFITENNIEDEMVKEHFYSAYFNHPLTNKDREDLLYFEKLHALLWCMWAQMQYSCLKDDVYEEIAEIKYKQLTKKDIF